MKYIALTRLRWHDTFLKRGSLVPIEPGRNYILMVRCRQIMEVPDTYVAEVISEKPLKAIKKEVKKLLNPKTFFASYDPSIHTISKLGNTDTYAVFKGTEQLTAKMSLAAAKVYKKKELEYKESLK